MKSYKTNTGFNVNEWYADNIKLEKNMKYLKVGVEHKIKEGEEYYKFTNLGPYKEPFMKLLNDVIGGLSELTLTSFINVATVNECEFKDIEEFYNHAFSDIKSVFIEQGLNAALSVKGVYTKALELSILMKNLKYDEGRWISCGRKWINENGVSGFEIKELNSPDLEIGNIRELLNNVPCSPERQWIEVDIDKSETQIKKGA